MALYDNHLWNNNNFPNKVNDEEDIIMVVRQDIIILYTRLLALFVIGFLLLIVRYVLLMTVDKLFVSLFDVIFYSILLVLLTHFTLVFHKYYLSVEIVTTDRIIDIDQKSLFQREVNELPIENIEDVTYRQNGFWGTLFNFGDVIVQTAGSGVMNSNMNMNGFVFNNAPYPSKVAEVINGLVHKNKREDTHEAARIHAEALQKIMNGGIVGSDK